MVEVEVHAAALQKGQVQVEGRNVLGRRGTGEGDSVAPAGDGVLGSDLNAGGTAWPEETVGRQGAVLLFQT